MVIYGEFLLIENMITGFIILWITGTVCGEKLHVSRIIMGSVLCGLFSFSIFLNCSTLINLIEEISFAGILIRICFKYYKIKRFLKTIVIFFLTTFLWGGISLGILYSFKDEAILAGGITYMEIATFLRLISVLMSGLLIIILAISLIKTYRMEERVMVTADIGIDGKDIELNGFIDSGNYLHEPLSGRPVAVVSKSVMEKIMAGIEDRQKRYTLIPYKSLGVSNGILEGYRMDYIFFSNSMIDKPIIAICNDNIIDGKNKEIEIILNSEMLERGLNV